MRSYQSLMIKPSGLLIELNRYVNYSWEMSEHHYEETFSYFSIPSTLSLPYTIAVLPVLLTAQSHHVNEHVIISFSGQNRVRCFLILWKTTIRNGRKARKINFPEPNVHPPKVSVKSNWESPVSLENIVTVQHEPWTCVGSMSVIFTKIQGQRLTTQYIQSVPHPNQNICQHQEREPR